MSETNIHSLLTHNQLKQSDSGFDTVKIEKLAVKEQRRERPVSSSGGDLSRDKVYQTFVRPVLNNVSVVRDLGAEQCVIAKAKERGS